MLFLRFDVVDRVALRADVLVADLLAESVGHLVDLRAEASLCAVQNLGDDFAVLPDDGLELDRHDGLSWVVRLRVAVLLSLYTPDRPILILAPG